MSPHASSPDRMRRWRDIAVGAAPGCFPNGRLTLQPRPDTPQATLSPQLGLLLSRVQLMLDVYPEQLKDPQVSVAELQEECPGQVL